MTVSYTSQVTRANRFGCFLKLLLKWRGSIYKLIWTDLLIFLGLFLTLSVVYHFWLDDNQSKIFEKIVIYCEKYGSLIPVSFVLGFYVSLVIGRWWQQYLTIPWIDTLAIWVNSNIRGEEETDRLVRRTLMRYVCLAITQNFILISARVKKRFPTLDHLVEAGLLLESEKPIIEEIEKMASTGAKYPTHFISLVWAGSLVARARQENKIKNDGVANVILTEINKIKDNCNLLLSYDWISVPLVYTQVVTLAVYTYFLACLMGKQWIKDSHKNASEFEELGIEILVVFFPVFTVLQFFFYMGWLKVAESLLNPFGDDDDDFELNYIVDRHIQVAYLIVDQMHTTEPELLRDQYWEQIVPPELPHTVASEVYKEDPPESSTANVLVSPDQGEIVPSPSLLNVQSVGSGGGSKGGTPRQSPKPRTSAAGASVKRERFGSLRPETVQEEKEEEGSKLKRIGSAFKRILRRERTVSASSSGGEEIGSLLAIPENVEKSMGDQPESSSLTQPPERSKTPESQTFELVVTPSSVEVEENPAAADPLLKIQVVK